MMKTIPKTAKLMTAAEDAGRDNHRLCLAQTLHAAASVTLQGSLSPCRIPAAPGHPGYRNVTRHDFHGPSLISQTVSITFCWRLRARLTPHGRIQHCGIPILPDHRGITSYSEVSCNHPAELYAADMPKPDWPQPYPSGGRGYSGMTASSVTATLASSNGQCIQDNKIPIDKWQADHTDVISDVPQLLV